MLLGRCECRDRLAAVDKRNTERPYHNGNFLSVYEFGPARRDAWEEVRCVQVAKPSVGLGEGS